MDSETIEMRPCKNTQCQRTKGYINWVNGQACVYCSTCGTYNYNAPKGELGLKPKSLRDNAKVKPSIQYRVIERANGICEQCRCPWENEVHIDHGLSVKDAVKNGVPPEIYNSEYNVFALCQSCNVSKGGESFNTSIFPSLLYARWARDLGKAD